ncbi:transcription repressor NadR [Alkaliphilus serpentinus]|uniref:Transcription repressor NadR n=1 Tax=Alkaliphilus serpentinus TaxID=1482731 RepID=A0A833HMU1_9FIRM|nr:transcription repressor NadR [Alkaliphilus serpentinus]KAB3528946.1 transcription repressor NadR [Alkaliphilus serpentinus]
MKAEDRRMSILEYLIKEHGPVKGTTLAAQYNVSRQVVVQDIALLRAQGIDIMATPQGYVISKDQSKGLIKTIVAKHLTDKEMEEELQIMLDYGARILDVIVEHPIYGDIKASLNISYKKELDEFMSKIKEAEPLSSLTEGVHIHTLEVPNEESYKEMLKALLKKGYLIND